VQRFRRFDRVLGSWRNRCARLGGFKMALYLKLVLNADPFHNLFDPVRLFGRLRA
jgi:hypothetical protein